MEVGHDVYTGLFQSYLYPILMGKNNEDIDGYLSLISASGVPVVDNSSAEAAIVGACDSTGLGA